MFDSFKVRPPRHEPYYVKLGQGCDNVVRCADCQSLVTAAQIAAHGICVKCGNRRFKEVRVLSDEEHAKISSGEIDFPYREEFLKEFGPLPEPEDDVQPS